MKRKPYINTTDELYARTSIVIKKHRRTDWLSLECFVAKTDHICELCGWHIRPGQTYYGNQYKKAHFFSAHRAVDAAVDPEKWSGLEIQTSEAKIEQPPCYLCGKKIDADQRFIENEQMVTADGYNAIVHATCLLLGMAKYRQEITDELATRKNVKAEASTLKELHLENERLRVEIGQLKAEIDRMKPMFVAEEPETEDQPHW